MHSWNDCCERWVRVIADLSGEVIREVSSNKSSFSPDISIETTERYLGCKQHFQNAVNDAIGLEPDGSSD